MLIRHIEISNFRKLQAARIDFADTTTVFVGANNSAKTFAMVALRRFLVERSEFSIHDFTLTHWSKLDALGERWEAAPDTEHTAEFNWADVLPTLDVWLNVPEGELHYVQAILPTLDWDGGVIGVRLRYEPKDVRALQHEYVDARRAALTVINRAKKLGEGTPAPVAVASAEGVGTASQQLASGNGGEFALWPRSTMDFLARRLRASFEVRTYLLDPAKLVDPAEGAARPQALPLDSEPVQGDPIKGLIRIDEISAQRGFGFASFGAARGDDEREDQVYQRGGKRLSSQLRAYYTKHLDPLDSPEPKDLEALQAMHQAQTAFGMRMTESFSASLN
jgi:hypothetical protein